LITQCYSLDNQLHCSIGKQLRARVFHRVLQDPSVHSYIERHMVPQRLLQYQAAWPQRNALNATDSKLSGHTW